MYFFLFLVFFVIFKEEIFFFFKDECYKLHLIVVKLIFLMNFVDFRQYFFVDFFHDMLRVKKTCIVYTIFK